MNYAMVANGYVIEVLFDCSDKPIWPPDGKGNVIHAIECGTNVERGMMYDSDKSSFYFSSDESIAPRLDKYEELLIDVLLKMEYLSCFIESEQ